MRSSFPISSKQMVVELNEIGEQLIKLLGYDIEVWDSNLDVSGVYDIIDATLLASGVEMIESRISGDTPIYSTFGLQELKYRIMRNV